MLRRRRADAPARAVLALRPLGLALIGAGLAAPGVAQTGGEGPARQIALEPRLSVQEVLTDNHQPGDQQGAADAITRVTAGLGWRGRSGMLRGFLDYALTGLVYARHSDLNQLQNALNANVTADLLEDRLQLRGAATIARNAISAFGTQPGGTGDNSSNVTETRTLQLAPTLRGPLGRSVRYQAGAAYLQSSSADSRVGDSASTLVNLHLEPAERARLGWTLDASRLDSDYKLGRKTQSDRLYGGLSYELEALDLQLSATAGRERTNLASLDSRSYTTTGLGLRWTPSPRTRLEVDVEERFFGRSHQIVAEYRLPRTVFRLRSGRSLSTSGSQVPGVRGTAFDVVDRLLSSAFPNAAAREVEVNKLLSALKIDDPNRIIDTGFLRSAATLQDMLEFSTVWTGLRDTAMLVISRGTTRRVDTITTAFDDLSRVDEVRTSLLSLTLSHRLTPLSSLGLVLGLQRSSSDQANLFSRQSQAELQWQTRLTPTSTLSASLRRAHYTTGLRSDGETALTASYGVRF